MRKFKYVGWLMALALVYTSCDSDEVIEYVEVEVPVEVPVEVEATEKRFTDEDSVTIINTKDIVIGEADEEEIMFAKNSRVLSGGGWNTERTLDFCGMAAIKIDEGEGEFPEANVDEMVEHTTVINRGTITIHTSKLVEKYKDIVRDPQNQDREFYYLRVLGLYAGKNCTIINEGTINVYFDHDTSVRQTIYVIAMTGDEGSTVINNGEIHFYGTGSFATRMRSVASSANNFTAINNNLMTVDVELAADTRMITTGGTNNNVVNNGQMIVRTTGKITCMTRFGDSNLVNNNLIEITSIPKAEGTMLMLSNDDYYACALYEPLGSTRTGAPSMVNRGTIHVKMEGQTDTQRQAYGMMAEIIEDRIMDVNFDNDGTIIVSQEVPGLMQVAEAGFAGKSSTPTYVANVNFGRWKTRLRDFSQTHDLFLAKGVDMNFTTGQLFLEKGDDYVPGTPVSVAPEALIYNHLPDKFSFAYSGYENLSIQATNPEDVLTWDKENMTVTME